MVCSRAFLTVVLSTVPFTAAQLAGRTYPDDGKSCISCTYRGDTFANCQQTGTSYFWCCTAESASPGMGAAGSTWDKCTEAGSTTATATVETTATPIVVTSTAAPPTSSASVDITSTAAPPTSSASVDITVTKCQSGKADLVGAATNVFTVQVCNLFGATCYMNQVETATEACATEALKIEPLQCALFPIMSYTDNARTDASKLLVGGGSGCSVSCTGTNCKFNGACVSVQCSLGGSPVTYAGPGMTKTGSGNARTVGVTNTGTAGSFEINTFAEIEVSGSKTVLLARAGNYVGTYSQGGYKSVTVNYNYGTLPTIAGNNYGPTACPSATTLVSARGTSKEDLEALRMCGVTGKWVYFGAANLLMDKSMYAKYSGDSDTGLATTMLNINSIPFLSGNSAYKSGDKMDDSRAVYLHDGAVAASVLLTSETISPATSPAMGTQDYPGQWRFYTVVFYCDNYARTDLTACPITNQKIFYVANPNPAPVFGITAAIINGGAPEDASGATRAVAGLAAFIIFAVLAGH